LRGCKKKEKKVINSKKVEMQVPTNMIVTNVMKAIQTA